MENIKQRVASDLAVIRANRPLIHQITNYVVMNETANMTLAVGALPVMAHAHEEVEEMVAMAGALVLNIGTADPYWIESMLLAGREAMRAGVPVILDPVGAGATTFRTENARRLLDELDIAVVRGNAGEIGALGEAGGEVRGVESVGDVAALPDVAAAFARANAVTVAVTGAQDIITDGSRTALVKNGDPAMACITGSGCMSTTVIGCFLAVEEDPFLAAVAGLTVFGLAGEAAAKTAVGPGTFHAALYDAVTKVDAKTVLEYAEVEAWT